ncbi:cytochrome b5 [Capsicum chacoense]
MPTLTKLFTMEEAAQHNTKDDCWVVIDGKVYDVSSYLDEHPGGDDVVLAVTGQDATDEFEDAGHSKSARELMEKFFIGELDPTCTSIPELEIVKKAGKNIPKKVMAITKQYWFVPVAVVGISVVVGFLYTRKK